MKRVSISFFIFRTAHARIIIEGLPWNPGADQRQVRDRARPADLPGRLPQAALQLQELAAVFGGYDAARYVHFFAMAAIVGFVVVHVVMALLVPKSLRAMITGR
jgi:hypothetical protein